MKYILYSPGVGGGWVSWSCGRPRDQLIFMLTHQPTIDALLTGAKFKESSIIEWALSSIHIESKETDGKYQCPHQKRFVEDWRAKFGKDTDTPYMGGFHQLKVYQIEEGQQFRIVEHVGSESIETEWTDTFHYLEL